MGQARYTYRVCPTCGEPHKTGERCEQCEAAATHSQSSDGDARVARVAQSLRPAIVCSVAANDLAVLTTVLDRIDQKGTVMPDDQLTPAELTDLDARAAEVLELCEDTTPGPWYYNDADDDAGSVTGPAPVWSEFEVPGQICDVASCHHDDQEFIAHARTDLPEFVRGYQKVRVELAAAASLLQGIVYAEYVTEEDYQAAKALLARLAK